MRERTLRATAILETIADCFAGANSVSIEGRIPEAEALLKQRGTLATTASKVRSSLRQVAERGRLADRRSRDE